MDKIIQIVEDLIKKEEIEWDTIINELIEKKIIDPLNIDLEKLVDYYISVIKELKKRENFDFILSSKVLILLVYFLKIKIELLTKEFLYNEFEEEILYEDFDETSEEKKEKKKEKSKKGEKKLMFKIFYERKRKVTLEDLKKAIEEIIKDNEKKKRKKLKKEDLQDLATLEYDIEKESENILKILEKIEKEELSFFELLSILNIKLSREEIIKKFIPLLYLDHQEKLEIKQKEILMDLLIRKLFGENKEIENNQV